MANERPIRAHLIDDDEDEFVLVQSASSRMVRRPIELSWSSTYDDGLDQMCRGQADVYLLDYRLGERDGLELVREAIGAGCQAPMIVLTGQADPDLDTAALRAGAADFIQKSELSPALLERSIHYAIERATSARLAASLSEQKRIEELRERLLGIIGHDLRNPLSSISMAGHLLLAQGSDDDPKTKIARRIVSSADYMARLINELLDFTRARLGGGIPIDPKPMSLSDVCRRAVEELQATYPDRAIELLAIADAHGVWDPDRVRQIVSNLVDNALQHGAPQTPVRVVIRASDSSDAVLEVQNQGAAIPVDVLPHVFDPFRRGGERDEREGSHRGLGLGLHIVEQIVAAHGGGIDVRSTDEGTTFTVRLPTAPVAHM